MNEIVQYNENTKIASNEDINVYLASEYINRNAANPFIIFPTMTEPLCFYSTRESLMDMDKYKNFIDNCIHRFRKSRFYKSYKAYLMSLGLDRCQINGNIQDGMAKIEMHHNFLTIYDITILISQHVLNTVGKCTTFDIVALLKQEHRLNHIPIVMLSETSHQLYHANPDFYIGIDSTFGMWWELLLKYRYGITMDIANKVVKYIRNCQSHNELNILSFYQLSNTILNWGNYNEYQYYHGNSTSVIDWSTSNGYINDDINNIS